MKARKHDVSRLDVERLAKESAILEGRWPLVGMRRLAESAQADARPGPDAEVAWQARAELRAARGGPQVWLHVRASTRIGLECQRCLQAVPVPIEIERSYRFVEGEDAAAELDADSEEDVLALTRSLDFHELVEDELLLALPLVPRHAQCPTPLPRSGGDVLPHEVAPHPFAALAALKGRKPGH